MITHLADPADFGGESLRVDGDAYRHLFRSRRLAVGAALRVVDGLGRARHGEVESVSKRDATIALGAPAEPREPGVQVELLVGALRPERADFLVEKATELGVVAIRFLRSARAPRTYGEGRLERLRRVASSAVEQCHRSLVPAVTLHEWAEVAALLGAGDGPAYVLAPGASERLPAASSGDGAGSVRILVGPEGGFDNAEHEGLRRLGARKVGLGDRILRVETAALAAASLVLLG